jgi:hypothetical protein
MMTEEIVAVAAAVSAAVAVAVAVAADMAEAMIGEFQNQNNCLCRAGGLLLVINNGQLGRREAGER